MILHRPPEAPTTVFFWWPRCFTTAGGGTIWVWLERATRIPTSWGWEYVARDGRLRWSEYTFD